jgi:hypothetical protein
MIELIELFRSLGFGALFGGGFLGLIYILFPSIFSVTTTIEVVLAVGGLLGAGTHQFIDKLFIKSILAPIGKFINFYSKLIQLTYLPVDKEQKKIFFNNLITDYFSDKK